MPDFIYYDDYNTDMGNWAGSTYYTDFDSHQQLSSRVDLIQQIWEEHQQMIGQQEKQAEELRKDKANYPLFFLKEGIV